MSRKSGRNEWEIIWSATLFVASGKQQTSADFSSARLVYVSRIKTGHSAPIRPASLNRLASFLVLQRLSRGGDPNLDGVSHVFVDEVHERSLDSDFLLLILKEVLQRNKNIKVVLVRLMSLSHETFRQPC